MLLRVAVPTNSARSRDAVAPRRRTRAPVGPVALLFALLATCGGCSSTTVIQPGHRGLVFDASRGLLPEVLGPGAHHVAGQIHDFDVTYASKTEALHLLTREALPVDMVASVSYRPIVSELYWLDTEIGPSYYDEIIGPELRAAARANAVGRSFTDIVGAGASLDDELARDLRRRTVGKHLEIASVRVERVSLPQPLADAVRDRAIAMAKTAREKAAHEGTTPSP